MVRHRRFAPRPHAFAYPVFYVFFDVDAIDELCRVSALISRNRFNWASFDDRDHLGDPALALRERIQADAAAHGVELPSGKIFLLTHLRYLGYVFNPVSYYYCYDAGGNLACVLADVRNTFGERHSYWMDGSLLCRGEAGRHYDFDKEFHVSPFLSMDCRYRFSFSEPGRRLAVHVKVWEEGEPRLDATLALAREDWTAGALTRCLLRYPVLTLKVIAAIHWEALCLWARGNPVFTHPAKSGKAART